MDIILLQRVPKLGKIGDGVRVKDGFARNYLLPLGKAVRATASNKKRFEEQRADLEARNVETRGEAQTQAEQLDGQTFVVLRQSGETGVLYGSVSTRDLAEEITKTSGIRVSRQQLPINAPIKTLGLHKVTVALHPEVDVTVTINVARSAEEAEKQVRGEEVFVREEDNLDDLGLEIGAALADVDDDDR